MKDKAFFQLIALNILVFPPNLLPIPFLHDIGTIVLYIALGLTLWSGIDYFLRFQKVFLESAGSK